MVQGRRRVNDDSDMTHVSSLLPYYTGSNSGYCDIQHGDEEDRDHANRLYYNVINHQIAVDADEEIQKVHLDFPTIAVFASLMDITLAQAKARPSTHTGTHCTWLILGSDGQLRFCSHRIVGGQANMVSHYEKHRQHPGEIPCPRPGCKQVFDSFKKFKLHYDGHRDNSGNGGKPVTPFAKVPVIPTIVEYLHGQYYMTLDKPSDPQGRRYFLLNRSRFVEEDGRDQAMIAAGALKGADDLKAMYERGEFQLIPELEKRKKKRSSSGSGSSSKKQKTG